MLGRCFSGLLADLGASSVEPFRTRRRCRRETGPYRRLSFRSDGSLAMTEANTLSAIFPKPVSWSSRNLSLVDMSPMA